MFELESGFEYANSICFSSLFPVHTSLLHSNSFSCHILIIVTHHDDTEITKKENTRKKNKKFIALGLITPT